MVKHTTRDQIFEPSTCYWVQLDIRHSSYKKSLFRFLYRDIKRSVVNVVWDHFREELLWKS